mgnify:CR=1 FL=1
MSNGWWWKINKIVASTIIDCVTSDIDVRKCALREVKSIGNMHNSLAIFLCVHAWHTSAYIHVYSDGVVAYSKV